MGEQEREWKMDTLPTQFECMLHFYYHLIPSRKRARTDRHIRCVAKEPTESEGYTIQTRQHLCTYVTGMSYNRARHS